MATIPQSIGKYRVKESLGAGGMGEVYLAHDTELDRPVAIKLLKKEDEPQARERFRREARTMAQINDERIVRIYDLLPWEDRHAIVMELVEGERILDYVARKKLPLPRILLLLREVAEGLAAAHAKGVIHRDLKAENVMISSTGKVKVLDLGLAKKLSASEISVTAKGERLGTLYCMSPEQAGRGDVDHRSDLFSLGVLCYLAVTGKGPFDGDSVAEILANVVNNPHTPARELNPAVSAELSELIDRLLEKDPNRRPQSAEEVATTLARLAGLPVGPRRKARPFWALKKRHGIDPRQTTSPMKGRRRKYLRWLAPAAVAAVLIAALLILRPGLGEPPSVAVLDFGNRTAGSGTTWPALGIPEILAAHLNAGGQLRAISRKRFAELNEDLPLAVGDPLSTAELDRLRQHMIAEAVAGGFYEVFDVDGTPHLRFDLRVQDATSGAVEWNETFEGPQTELFELVGQAADKLRKALAADPLSAEEKRRLRALVPADLRAARLYFEGLYQVRRPQHGAALDLFRQAEELEPAHPVLRSMRAATLRELGLPEAAAAAREAWELSAGLPRRQQLEIEARYHWIAAALQEAARVYGDLWREFRDVDYGIRLVEMEVQAGRGDKALAAVAALRQRRLSPRTEARLDLAVADVYYDRGEFDQAKTLADRAAQTAERLHLTYLLARARFVQGKSLNRMADSTSGLEVLGRALVAFQQVGSQPGVDETFNLMAVVHAGRNELSEARELLRIYLKGSGGGPGRVIAVINLCNVLFERGFLTAARTLLEDTITAGEDDLGDMHKAVAQLIFGYTSQALGELDQARQHYEAARRVFQALERPRLEASATKNFAEVLFLQGELEEAHKLQQQALEIDAELPRNEERLAYDHWRLGKIFCARGKLSEAAIHYEKALALWNAIEKPGEAAQTQLAQAELKFYQYDFGLAAILAEEAQAQLSKSKLSDWTIRAQVVLARALLKQNRVAEARKKVQSALSQALGSESALVDLETRLVQAETALAEGQGAGLEMLAVVAEDAAARGFMGHAFEARLLLGESELQTDATRADGQRRLRELIAEAGTRDFGLIVERARRALEKAN